MNTCPPAESSDTAAVPAAPTPDAPAAFNTIAVPTAPAAIDAPAAATAVPATAPAAPVIPVVPPTVPVALNPEKPRPRRCLPRATASMPGKRFWFPRIAPLPSSLLDFRAAALQRFHETPPPATNSELWRFSKPPELRAINLQITPPGKCRVARKTLVERSNARVAGPIAASLFFVDGHLMDATPLPERLLAQGVYFEPLEIALAAHPGLLEEHFARQRAPLGSEQALALHHAHLRAGYVLRIPDGVEIEEPFVIHNWIRTFGSCIFPSALVVAGAGSRVRVAEFHLGASVRNINTLSLGTAGILAGPGAHVQRVTAQYWNARSGRCWQIETLRAERDATLENITLNLGSVWMRHESEIHLTGPGATVRPLALSIATGGQFYDQRTLQVHDSPDANSSLLYKNALSDQSRVLFSGLIQVAPGAQRTDAYQTNRNLLLSPEAEAVSLPGLEIAANDVKCSHGTTNSEVAPDELFYLNARGIPDAAARELCVSGFFEEVINRAPTPAIADALRTLIREKLHEKLQSTTTKA